MTSTHVRIVVSEIAARAIVEQADYYEMQKDRDLARRWEESARKAFLSLQKLPRRGALCHFRVAGLHALRWIPIDGFPQHMIFYKILRDRQTIRIVHVLHGARDVQALISERLGK